MTFYVLRSPKWPSESLTDFVEDEGFSVGDAPKCSECGRYIGMMKWLPPYRVELDCWGPRFGDLAFGGEDILVSERFKVLYHEQGLSGLLGFDPVEICRLKRRGRLQGRLPQYYRVHVKLGEATIDQHASGFVWGEPPTCSVCVEGQTIKRWERIVIAPGTWSGEDVCRPRGLFLYLTTQRFKEFCERFNITNATFVPALECEHDAYPWENTARAAELAKLSLSDDLLEKVMPSGETWRYYVPRNELVAIGADGSIRSMCRPVEGRELFDRL